MNTAQQYYGQSVPMQQFDYQSALALSETRNIIEYFYRDWCGLQISKDGNKITVQRVSKPIFTYEFSKKLESEFFIEINRITGRTSYTTDRLNQYYLKKAETRTQVLAVEGIHHLISEKAWNAILEMKKKELWGSEHNIEWDYDDPVNVDMLMIVKKEYDLENESFGQDSILRNLFWSMQIFIEGGLNRSENHLTLDHEKVVHKESVIQNTSEEATQKEGVLESAKRWINERIGG